MMDSSRAQNRSDLVEVGEAAERRGDSEAALVAWDRFRAQYSSEPTGYLRAAKLLRAAQRPAEAEAVCDEALAKCSNRFGLLVERAGCANDRNDWREALDRWTQVDREFPAHPVASIWAGQALVRLGDFDEAETRLAEARLRFPSHRHIERLFAQVASQREDWKAAGPRWDIVAALFPNDLEVVRQRGIANWHLQQLVADPAHGVDAEEIPSLIATISRVSDPEARDLVMKFESIGNHCEFALVQRRFEAEPLGLLRWTATSPALLLRLLEHRFADLGKLENLELKRTPWKEHVIGDTHYGAHFHTFQTTELADPHVFLEKHSARIRWLRDKFLADLAAGEKILVYRPGLTDTADDVEAIFKAFRVLGPVNMLCVGLCDADNSAGSVRAAKTGLFFGFLSRLNPVAQKTWDIPNEEWLSVCRGTVALAERERS